MSTAAQAPARRISRIEPAELLYGRLLASAAAGGDALGAGFRLAGGNVHGLPLRR